MKHFLLIFSAIFGLVLPVLAQTYQREPAVIQALNTQLLRYKKAVMEDNSEEAIALTHPDMIRMMGGIEKMRASTKKGKEIRDSYKLKFVALEYTLPDSILVTEASYQLAFPFDLVTQFEDGTTIPDRMLMIAYKDIPLNKWYFLTVPYKDIDKIRPTFKFVDPELVLPE
jgi:hypothetical protein